MNIHLCHLVIGAVSRAEPMAISLNRNAWCIQGYEGKIIGRHSRGPEMLNFSYSHEI
jgi:hypothetical protein